jgi:Uma2 family endonuclease
MKENEMAVPLTRRRFTVGEYSRMADAGIFSEDDRVELIDGAVVDMVPIGAPHAGVIIRLNHLLSRLVGDRAMISPQNPVRLSDYSEPLPDVMLLRPRPDFYTSAHPGAGDVLLLVEIADTSVDYDRSIKVPLYARHGVLEVWVVDLQQQLVEIYRDPAPAGYREIRVAPRGDRLTPLAMPDVALLVDDILL